METTGFVQGFLFAIWLAYILTKDVVIPLMQKFTGKKHVKAPDECPLLSPVAARVSALEPVVARMPVLEINLGKQEMRIAEFSELLKEHTDQNTRASTALDDKLDIVLAELQQFRVSIENRLGGLAERVKGVETHVEHLLHRRRGAGD